MRCETEGGCPISDIAPNPKAEKIIAAFIQSKTVKQMSGLASVAEVPLISSGLLNDPELMIDFEEVWIEFLKHRQKITKAEAKATASHKKPKGRR